MHEIDEMLMLQLEGKHDEARRLSDKLENIGPDKILDAEGKNSTDIWLRHSFNRGWFLIRDGDYQAGSKCLESGRFLNVYGSPPLKTSAPMYNPSLHDIKDKTILISLEGGLGDEIIHARFASSYKKLGAKKVILAAAPELISVLKRMTDVNEVIQRDQVVTTPHDFWIPGFSAGWVAGHTFDDFPGKPYLTPSQQKVDEWKEKLKTDKIKIGIRWAGNPMFEHQQMRRFPEKFILNLHQYKELQLYSMQRDNNLLNLPEGIIDLQNEILTWEDTMGCIQNLDLVITSCTSVAHLSAAMGKETWVIVPILPYHTWTYKSPDTNKSPYYETVTLYRQQHSRRTWNNTFQLLYKDLEEKFNLAHIELPNEDRKYKKLNLGSGFLKFQGFVNVDNDEKTNPDINFDLLQFPWPFEDDEFDHVIARNVLEYVGKDENDFFNVLKEMYRISCSGALWEVEAPHWHHQNSVNDPKIKRVITPSTLQMFNKGLQIENLRNGKSRNTYAFDYDIDIEVSDSKFIPTKETSELLKNSSTTEQFHYMNHMNDSVESVRYLVTVHKPGRIDKRDYLNTVEKLKIMKHDLKAMAENV